MHNLSIEWSDCQILIYFCLFPHARLYPPCCQAGVTQNWGEAHHLQTGTRERLTTFKLGLERGSPPSN